MQPMSYNNFRPQIAHFHVQSKFYTSTLYKLNVDPIVKSMSMVVVLSESYEGDRALPFFSHHTIKIVTLIKLYLELDNTYC